MLNQLSHYLEIKNVQSHQSSCTNSQPGAARIQGLRPSISAPIIASVIEGIVEGVVELVVLRHGNGTMAVSQWVMPSINKWS